MPKNKQPNPTLVSITDPRFQNFESDPRYQLPSKKHIKTKIDKRFSRVLKDAEFVNTAKVDRYGRKLKSDTKKKALQRLYEDEDEDEDGESEGGGAEVDDDEIVRRELERADEKHDPARGGGFSSSESDSDSDDSDEAEEEDAEGGETADSGLRRFREAQAVEEGEVTNRIAIVNLDWDHIRSVDLMALFSSFLPAGGRIEKISIYPSEFGKERMQREEVEGPPKELFKKSTDDDQEAEETEDDSETDSEDGEDAEDSDEEIKKELLQEANDQDFNSDALRTYQLDRLRYYYAVMVCSDNATAHKLYEAVDGTEYLSSSNFLDLRFIPDDVTFDDEPRDECDKVPSGYKPVEFVTDALQHSKVKLTWDMHPDEVSRKDTIQRAFTGSRNDIAENDLRAYLASDSEDDEDEDIATANEKDGEDAPLSAKELARRKMRAALGLGDEPEPKASKSAAPVGGMHITFKPALSEATNKKDAETEETTIEKYKRKERERKERKKALAVAKREGLDPDAVTQQAQADDEPAEDLGFDDPFFTTEPVAPTKSALRKEERLKKRAAREAQEAENAAQKAQLELLMADNADESTAHLDHFDMREVMRAEKQKGKKKRGKKGKSGEDRGGLQEDFNMDVEDDRFKAVFENHEFAIDPSNAKFKATQGMKKILEEGRKKRKVGGGERTEERRAKKVKGPQPEHDGGIGIDSLINAVKKKASDKS
ncbi:hypothetical protein QBC46DRAFT_51235 [Diplogelasinospora grovesii]|uniref:NUC153 domain-containing protein n=1 Tax=Diplogelasinospora grovesii TaxID=303347 RepID=A0AAN6MXR2_9PEZI|nr:hypothetical protein QBC46DRAFT_51235 [Diplogelasinospora grovesii]